MQKGGQRGESIAERFLPYQAGKTTPELNPKPTQWDKVTGFAPYSERGSSSVLRAELEWNRGSLFRLLGDGKDFFYKHVLIRKEERQNGWIAGKVQKLFSHNRKDAP